MINKSHLDKPIGTDISGKPWVVDEDDMASDLDTKVPTQQSVKKYVDDNAGGISDADAIKWAIVFGG